jgi:hypothetical protein
MVSKYLIRNITWIKRYSANLYYAKHGVADPIPGELSPARCCIRSNNELIFGVHSPFVGNVADGPAKQASVHRRIFLPIRLLLGLLHP